MSKAVNKINAKFRDCFSKDIPATGKINDRYFINDIMYTGRHMPFIRLVRSPSGQVVELFEYRDAVSSRLGTFFLPDIGVRSRHEGDRLSLEELHMRLKYLLLMDASAFPVEATENRPAFALKDARKSLISKLNEHYARWEKYSNTFGLGWGPLPELYKMRLNDILESKIRRWDDPAAVEARERTAARRQAKKAMGLDK